MTINSKPPLKSSNLKKIGRRSKPAEVVQIEGGYKVLHPTKGYRRLSSRRFMVSKREMVMTHHAVIAAAGGTFPVSDVSPSTPRRLRNTRAMRRAARIDAMRKDLRVK